ncbi:hypothetical protein LIER_23314 [Lithospermum erythrorhizon]|uniref:Pentatricopeptide repeat-containing protein n=1 Tax=Lithospermum erythrorhizon TaxID=34254 RepID=A0AAV3R2L1_LITER
MRRLNVHPNNFTFSAILHACANTFVIFHGLQVHALCVKHGFNFDVYVGSALLDMYAKCGEMINAKEVFDEMPERNLVSWNSMIVGYLQNECFDEAINCFIEVLREATLKPDQVSFSSFFCACGNLCDAVIGRQGHGVAVKLGLVSLPYVNNSLMDMYCRCGSLCDANSLFGSAGVKDVVTWNVMIMGCVQNHNFEDACKYFWVMRQEGVLHDEASYSSALHAVSCIAVLLRGTLIHGQIIKTGFSRNICVSSSLITMYSKCGNLEDALRAFRESEERNVVSWNSIISACNSMAVLAK